MRLISSGCSFSDATSEDPRTWPQWLSIALDVPLTHCGLPSAGNGIISRDLLFKLHNHNYGDILVGVMWSGIDRKEKYGNNMEDWRDPADGWVTNPYKFNPDDTGAWTLLNAFWQNKMCRDYFRQANEIQHQIETLEHMLRVQWYLQANNIKYFFTNYKDAVFEFVDHPACKHLYDMLDHSKFLPSIYEFSLSQGTPFTVPGDDHPSPKQQRFYTKRIILPFLRKEYGIKRASN